MNQNLSSIQANAQQQESLVLAAQADFDSLSKSLEDALTANSGQAQQIASLTGALEQLKFDLISRKTNFALFTGLEKPDGWVQDGNSGNTGGASAAPHGTSTWTADGIITTKPAGPYDEFFWHNPNIPFNPDWRYFAFGLTITPLAGSLGKSQAFEWEIEASYNGTAFDGGKQVLLKSDGKDIPICFRQFDYTRKWEKTTAVALPDLVEGQPLKVLNLYKIDLEANVITRVGVALNGTWFPIGDTSAGKPKFAGKNYLHPGWQMDTDSKGEGYSMQLSDVWVAAF